MADATSKKDELAKEQDVPKAAQQVKEDIASDPEEDDLSDLDDVLDEFSNVNLKGNAKAPTAPAPSSSGPGRPEAQLDPTELLVEDQNDFEKELQKQMEALLGQEGFPKEFQDLMEEMGNVVGEDPLGAGAPAAGASSSKADEEPAAKGEQTFQESIRKTMERMRESGDAAGAAAAASSEDNILAQMLKEMESGNFGGGEENDEDFSKILMGMMEQLTNKEILYEPMKELNDKFPDWMEKNKGKVDAGDWQRYEEQASLVKEIVARFEKSGYSDDNAQDREYIVERMQKMQTAGAPPPDLVGDMNATQEALQEMDQGCPTQ
ncbi:Pex19-domain-containing protein [Bimuria novae-zelandiae CBS 107.79]|uniref:Pex19-domain-containing protein n=1 Tax=Bimuria novae-zelandiae CBS 107.79 TaxID=1447943 RepID=A0A6A5UJ36_9PLEO|nr:Pex19-domain-containing protein [Bimuria novae-zelandiae CBS 107.79]